jgi:hypothetical protein
MVLNVENKLCASHRHWPESHLKLSPVSSAYVDLTVKPIFSYQATVARTSGTWIIGTTFLGRDFMDEIVLECAAAANTHFQDKVSHKRHKKHKTSH